MNEHQTSILQASALDLQQRLTDGSLTSVALTTLLLDQVERHNHCGLKLNAVISLAPRDNVLAAARSLDLERRAGVTRSKLHGIPIIVKDGIITEASLGMPTTVGSHVFAALKAKKNAALVDKLVNAGLIILGKANMTEFCPTSRLAGVPTRGKRCRRIGVKISQRVINQQTAGGSSSGSAVSVAAGFCPLAIGTETAGSAVYPAICNGLYAMKLTPASVPNDGVFQLSESFDGVGVMARDPADLAALTEILQTGDNNAQQSVPEKDIATAKNTPLAGLSIGVVSNTWGLFEEGHWIYPDVVTSYEDAAKLFKKSGARVVYPLEAPESKVLEHKSETLRTVSYHEFASQVQRFINNFEDEPEIKSLADIISWNREHADVALPEPHSSQSELIEALNNTMTEEVHDETVAVLRELSGPQGLGNVMREQELDVILAPSSSTLVSFAACARWPIAAVPLSRVEKNGQPYGFFAVARDGREDLLFRFMAAYHQVFPPLERPSAPFM